MKSRLLLKLVIILIVLIAGTWYYLTEFQKFRVRRIFDQVHEELVSGRMDKHRIMTLDMAFSNISGNALVPSVKKYADSYVYEYARSGNPEKFTTAILIDRPNLKWANGIGRSITIPVCIMLLEDAKKYPPETRTYMEEIACNLLPKATGQSYGVNGIKFLEADDERATAIQQWHEWYQTNKYAVLERDQRVNAAVESSLGQQKKFVQGVLDPNKGTEQRSDVDGHQSVK